MAQQQMPSLRSLVSFLSFVRGSLPVASSPDRYNTQEEFVADLKEMWFGLYSRGKDEGDSSGFEHVFAGTVRLREHTAWAQLGLE